MCKMQRRHHLPSLVVLICVVASTLNGVVRCSTAPLDLSWGFDNAQFQFVINPPDPSLPINVVPVALPMCSTCTAFRMSAGTTWSWALNNVSTYGAAIDCLSISSAPSPASGASCTPGVQPSLRVTDGGSQTLLDNVALSQIFNGSIQSMLVATSSPISVWLDISVLNCETDIVLCSAVEDVSAAVAMQPPVVTSMTPQVVLSLPPPSPSTNNTNSSNAVNITTTVQMYFKRLALSQALTSPYQLFIMPSNHSCSALTLFPDGSNSLGFPLVNTTIRKLGISNLNLVANVTLPSVVGSYFLCVGLNNVTFVSVGVVEVLGVDPSFVVTPWDVTDAQTVDVLFVGSHTMNASVDRVFVSDSFHACEDGIESNTVASSSSLQQKGVGRVAARLLYGAVPLGTTYRYCYRLGGAGGHWREVPPYIMLDQYTVSSLLNYVSMSGSGSAFGPIPNPPTPVPAPTPTPIPGTPGTPSPTLPGGCGLASARSRQLFSGKDGVEIEINGNLPSITDLVNAICRDLCISQNSLWLRYVGRHGSYRYLTLQITDTNTYSGLERMAYFSNEYFNQNSATLASQFGISAVFAYSSTNGGVPFGASSGSGDGTTLAQLIIGGAIGGVVALVLCLCGGVVFCCRRLRERTAEVNPVIAAARAVELGVRVVDPDDLHPAIAANIIVARNVILDSDSEGPDPSDEASAVTGVVIGGEVAARRRHRGRRRSGETGGTQADEEMRDIPHTGSSPMPAVYGCHDQLGYLPSSREEEGSSNAAVVVVPAAPSSKDVLPGTPSDNPYPPKRCISPIEIAVTPRRIAAQCQQLLQEDEGNIGRGPGDDSVVDMRHLASSTSANPMVVLATQQQEQQGQVVACQNSPTEGTSLAATPRRSHSAFGSGSNDS